MEPVEPVLKKIYQSNTYRKDLSWPHFDDEVPQALDPKHFEFRFSRCFTYGMIPPCKFLFFPKVSDHIYFFQIQPQFREIQAWGPVAPSSNLQVQNFWKMKLSKIYKNVFCDYHPELVLLGNAIVK